MPDRIQMLPEPPRKRSRAAEFQRRVELENEAVARWRASGKPAAAFDEFISPELRQLMVKPATKLQHGKATR